MFALVLEKGIEGTLMQVWVMKSLQSKYEKLGKTATKCHLCEKWADY